MKKIILFTVATASVIAAYLLVKNCECANDYEDQSTKPERQRHLTKAFSNAKLHAVS